MPWYTFWWTNREKPARIYGVQNSAIWLVIEMILMDKSDLLDQAGMERAFSRYFEDVKGECGDTLNAMLDAHVLSCDFAARSVVLWAETTPWMANPGGITHGGISAAYLDLVMGLLCRYFSNGHMTVSIHMDVNYLRAIPIGTRLCIQAKITKAGKSICFVEGSLWAENDPEELLATAGGAYSVAKPKE